MAETSLLVDLRPALNGHAGIPVETRHVFSILRSLPEDEVAATGLLHSASGRLRPALLSSQDSADGTYQTARLISAFFPEKHEGRRAIYQAALKRAFYVRALMRSAARDRSLPLSPFDAETFENFLWTRLFDKTLPATERKRVVAAQYLSLEPPWGFMSVAGLRRRNFGTTRQYPLIDTNGFDYFIAQSPFPGRVTPGTTLLVRYHDSVPLFYPHTIENRKLHLDSHYFALRANIDNGAEFVCISEATRKALLDLFPILADRTHVIHNQISTIFHSAPVNASKVSHILRNRLLLDDSSASFDSLVAPEAENYLLVVSTLEPRKNHRILIDAWEAIKRDKGSNLKLVIVGGDSWESDELTKRLTPWGARGEILRLANVPSEELRILYQHAALTICPSYEEGFDLSGVEAMASGGAVAASDIPVHREIFGAGAVYFDPYDSQTLVDVLDDLIDNPSARASLVQAGLKNAARFRRETIVDNWRAFLKTARRNNVTQ